MNLESGAYRTKYMTFRRVRKANTEEWEITNNKYGDALGEIVYYPGWRQYVFRPETGDTEFNYSCLNEISAVLVELNKTLKPVVQS